MYRKKDARQLEFPDFYLPFSGCLDPENRWITLATLVPWQLAEEIYVADLCEDSGAPVIPARTALGALLIKEKLGLTDRETVATIKENPYMQFFIGLEEFSKARPFDASMMVEFRKRFGEEGIQEIADAIALAALQQIETTTSPDQEDEIDRPSTSTNTQNNSPESTEEPMENSSTNHGQLIVDATCTPADIRYPTDVSLLNEAREKTDELIDEFQIPLIGTEPRPRTYREKARKKFVAFTKKKRPGRKAVRRAKREQLCFLRRNLRAIDQLAANPGALPLGCFSKRLYKNLLVCRELYRQQLEMFTENKQRVDDRIVSISQPHVRPIIRGKAGRAVEFGAKISVSVIDGFSFVDRLSWDNYNESLDLVGQIEKYHRQFGFYPESLHADQIYRTRANRKYCKERGIRLSGPPLGRPPKELSAAEKLQSTIDEGIRNRVEGKFGEAKRRYGLGRIMAKLMITSGAQISLSFLVMNLEESLRRFFLSFILLCPCLMDWLIVGGTGRSKQFTTAEFPFKQLPDNRLPTKIFSICKS